MATYWKGTEIAFTPDPATEPTVNLDNRDSLIAWLEWDDPFVPWSDTDTEAAGERTLGLEEAQWLYREVHAALLPARDILPGDCLVNVQSTAYEQIGFFVHAVTRTEAGALVIRGQWTVGPVADLLVILTEAFNVYRPQ